MKDRPMSFYTRSTKISLMRCQVLHGKELSRTYYLLSFEVASKKNKHNYLKKAIKILFPFPTVYLFEASFLPIILTRYKNPAIIY